MMALPRVLVLVATAADAALLSLAAIVGDTSPQVFYGFLALLGGLIGTAALYLAVGKWAIRRLEQLEDSTEKRHTENIQAQQKMWAFLLGVEGVGGMRDDQKRNQRRRHEMAQDMTVVFGALSEHTTQIARLSDKAGLDFDPPELDRPKRRMDDHE
jgi:hypothetical protein